MKANELRIGNWFNEFGIPKQVTPNLILKLYQIEIAGKVAIDISPIPLTPEILVKAGFENKSSTTDYIFEYGNFIIGGTRKRLFPSVWGEDGLQDYGNLIEYVHELQNLYFALTGKELTFDL
jgi:hypothetical protein